MPIKIIPLDEAAQLVSPAENLRGELRKAIAALKPDEAIVYEVKGKLTTETVRSSASSAARSIKVPITCTKIPGTENLLIRRKM